MESFLNFGYFVNFFACFGLWLFEVSSHYVLEEHVMRHSGAELPHGGASVERGMAGMG